MQAARSVFQGKLFGLWILRRSTSESCFTWSSPSDSSCQTRQGIISFSQSRQRGSQLSKFDLNFAFTRFGSLSENIQYKLGPVDNFQLRKVADGFDLRRVQFRVKNSAFLRPCATCPLTIPSPPPPPRDRLRFGFVGQLQLLQRHRSPRPVLFSDSSISHDLPVAFPTR